MHRRSYAAVMSAVSLTAMSGAALAQANTVEPQANNEGRLQEIVVTAQHRSESMQSVPVAITAITGDALIRSGVDSQRTLALVTPNLTMNSSSQFVAPYLRGVGTQYANPGLESSVATYFDDVYQARPSASQYNFNDVERVEVLRGPQGILYGRNSSGGAIRVIPKQPVYRFEGNVNAGVGSYRRYMADGVLNVPVGEEAAFRVTGLFDTNNGFIRNQSGGPRLGDRNVWMITGQFKAQLNDNLTVRIAADYNQKHDRESQAFFPAFRTAPNQVGLAQGGQIGTGFYDYAGNYPGDGAQKQQFEQGGVALHLTYEADPFTIKSITAFRYNRFDGAGDLDGTSANLLVGGESKELTRQYSQEFQLTSSSTGIFKYQLGAFAYREVSSAEFGLSGAQLDAALFPGARLGGDGSVLVESLAPYGQASLEPIEGLEITAGARFTAETKTLRGNEYYITATDRSGFADNSLFVPLGMAARRKMSFDELTPKFGISYEAFRGGMIYASYSKGFKSGGYNLPDPDPATPPDEVGLEKNTAYEAGWKFQQSNIRINGSLFHYTIKGLQLGQFDQSAGVTTVRNAASAKIKGIDLDATWVISDRLQIDASGGYLHAKFHNYMNGPVTIPCADAPAAPSCVSQGGLGLLVLTGDLSGHRLPFAPKYTASARINYRQPLPGNAGQLRANAVYSYSSRYSFESDGFLGRPALSLVNASLDWESQDEALTASLGVSNLFDKKYTVAGTSIASTGGFLMIGRPREVSFRIGHRF
ncbi:iron complex outermembrane recepter protein [Sphingobium faniae]|nr:iron complex outermembrane recepter protein [Sphingobium faniae]